MHFARWLLRQRRAETNKSPHSDLLVFGLKQNCRRCCYEGHRVVPDGDEEYEATFQIQPIHQAQAQERQPQYIFLIDEDQEEEDSQASRHLWMHYRELSSWPTD